MSLTEKLNIEKFDVPAVSESHINSLEKLIGNNLPGSYRNFLLVYNGGFPTAANVFRNSNSEFLFSHFFSLENPQGAVIDEKKEGVLTEYKAIMTQLPRNYLPFASEPTGDVYVLDTSFGENAPVYIWLHDADEELVKLADSFEDFISKLEFDPEYD
jgi:hypothetical protein